MAKQNQFLLFFSIFTELGIKIASVFTDQGQISTEKQRQLIQNSALSSETENIILRFNIAENLNSLRIVQYLVYILIEHVGFYWVVEIKGTPWIAEYGFQNRNVVLKCTFLFVRLRVNGFLYSDDGRSQQKQIHVCSLPALWKKCK